MLSSFAPYLSLFFWSHEIAMKIIETMTRLCYLYQLDVVQEHTSITLNVIVGNQTYNYMTQYKGSIA